jgi:HEAT repeat protein
MLPLPKFNTARPQQIFAEFDEADASPDGYRSSIVLLYEDVISRRGQADAATPGQRSRAAADSQSDSEDARRPDAAVASPADALPDAPTTLEARIWPDTRLGRLRRSLAEGDSATRWDTLIGMARMKGGDKRAIPEICMALSDPEVRVRKSALWCLLSMKEDAREAVPMVVHLLKDDSAEVRRAAVDTLRFICDKSSAPVRELGTLLEDESEEVRVMAGYALGSFAPDAAWLAEEVIDWILGGSVAERRAAASALSCAKRPTRAVMDAMADALFDTDTRVRRYAASGFTAWGPLAAHRAADLQRATLDADGVVKGRAVLALARAGLAPAEVLPWLERVLGSRSQEARIFVVRALREVGGDASDVAPLLRRALTDKIAGVRVAAAYAIPKLAPSSAALAALADAVDDRSVDVQRAAMEGLYAFGSEAKVAVPQFRRALASDNEEVRARAAVFLGSLGREGKAGLPELVMALRDDAPLVRTGALRALTRITPTPEKFEPLFTRALADPNANVRREAISALRACGKDVVRGKMDRLRALLTEDPDASVRNRALRAIWWTGSDRKLALKEIMAAVNDADADVRSTAVNALRHIDADPSVIAIVLTKASADEDFRVRTNSRIILRKIASMAREALPELRRIEAEDEDERVRKACQRSIRLIEKAPEE